MDVERGTSEQRPSLVEHGFVCLVLFLATGAFQSLLRLGGGEIPIGAATRLQVEGDPLQQRLWLAVYVVVAGLVARQHRAVLAAAMRSPLLWVLVTLPLLSTLWSTAPPLTLRRSVLLLATTGFGAYLVARFHRDRLFGLLSAVLGAIAVLSLILALAFPAYGRAHGIFEGAWRGVFFQKNELGQAMALGATIWLLRLVYPRGPGAVNLAFFGLSTMLLVLSDSKSSLVLFAALAATIAAIRAFQMGAAVSGLGLVLAGIAGPAAAVWLPRNYEALLGALGRNPTLTGRTAYWEQAWSSIAQRPVLGHGYGAFWRGPEGPSADFIVVFGEDSPAHAHNGLLDLWLVLGVVGVLLFVCLLVLNLFRALARLGRERSPEGVFPFVFVLFLAGFNATESDIMTYNTLLWMVYAAITVQLASAVFPSVAPRSAVAVPASPEAPAGRPRFGPAPPAPVPAPTPT